MNGRTLVEVVDARTVEGDINVRIDRLAYDSRNTKDHDAFFCIVGSSADGHEFAHDAVENGATVVVGERPTGSGAALEIIVDDSRLALAAASGAFYQFPSSAFRLYGVTGTNGKTTTAYLLEHALRAMGLKTGMVGTVEYRIGDDVLPVTHTTPESLELQEIFHFMRESGVEEAVMEVSSHAIHQRRIVGTAFDVLVFTNLSQDHLDYHGDIEAYWDVKRSLFQRYPRAIHVLNVDDERGRELQRMSSTRTVTFGIDRRAEVIADEIMTTPQETTFVLVGPFGRLPCSLPLRGRFNVSNALAAFTAMYAVGYEPAVVAGALASARPVPGRFEVVDCGQPFLVIVDYAHTPDGLEKVLQSARSLRPRSLRCVFGCGGDRDRGKRPRMGALASELADSIIVTSDNPRSEAPDAIIEEILAGVDQARRDAVSIEPDRRTAITQAILDMEPGDVLVIAGKGHETYQIFKDRTIHFDDREEARKALQNAGYPECDV